MSTFEFVLLCVGAFIVLTSFDLTPIWNFVKNKVSSIKVPSIPDSSVTTVPDVSPKVWTSEDPLIDIVKKWNALKDSCESEGLTEAVAKLNEIFPVLIKVETPKGDS